LLCILVAVACSVQEFCLGCNIRLSRVRVVNHHRYCLNCHPPLTCFSPPPLSPLSSPPASPPLPLFDRQPSSHQPLSPIERAAAITLSKLEFTQQNAADQLGTTRQTISHWKHTFEEMGDVKDRLRCGRKRKTTEQKDENLVMMSTINTRFTPKELKKELDLNVSPRTIDRRLQEAGLFGRVALKKRAFDEEEKKQRLAFANGYKDWKEKEWERVLFADESIIQGEGSTKGGRQWVRREKRTAEALKSENVHHHIAHPKQLNIWACFSSAGLGYCYIHNETLDAKSFVNNVLNTHLLQSADLLFTESPRQQWYLLHDNAPIHTAKLTRKWLYDHGITCLDFPPYSPDLNPIENLWQYIEKRVEERALNTIEELQDVIAEEWKNTPIDLLIKLVHSMPKRCLAVIATEGDHTHH
jgi:transposase